MSRRIDRQRRPVAIEGGRIVTPGRPVDRGTVLLAGSTITSVGSGRVPDDAERIDATGRLVFPGFVDLHGDDVEFHLEPKPGAAVDARVALTVCDRLNLAAGITTKLHAVAFEDAPTANRSIERARAVIDAVAESSKLLADHRVHVRCEISDPAAVEAVLDVLDRPAIELVSLMNHAPGKGQFETLDAFAREYVTDGQGSPSQAAALARERAAIDPSTRSERIETIGRRARAASVPVAAHDVEDPQRVEALVDRGIDIMEYPTTLAAVRRAQELDATVAMGAPNLVRGGSLWGNVGVGEALNEAAVQVLCSDFHPPSMLLALFADTDEPLDRAVERVTTAPAAAVGLDDRGRLEPGHRADVVVVDPGDPPVVERVFVGGTEAYRAVGRARVPGRP